MRVLIVDTCYRVFLASQLSLGDRPVVLISAGVGITPMICI